MLLSRYGSIDYIMSLDFEDGINQIHKAEEKDIEEKLFLRWAIAFQMESSFTDFKNKLMTNSNITDSSKSKEEILADVRKIFMKKVGE